MDMSTDANTQMIGQRQEFQSTVGTEMSRSRSNRNSFIESNTVLGSESGGGVVIESRRSLGSSETLTTLGDNEGGSTGSLSKWLSKRCASHKDLLARLPLVNAMLPTRFAETPFTKKMPVQLRTKMLIDFISVFLRKRSETKPLYINIDNGRMLVVPYFGDLVTKFLTL
jgi:hypothetical protein